MQCSAVCQRTDNQVRQSGFDLTFKIKFCEENRHQYWMRQKTTCDGPAAEFDEKKSSKQLIVLYVFYLHPMKYDIDFVSRKMKNKICWF
jgi:hypothetical protein